MMLKGPCETGNCDDARCGPESRAVEKTSTPATTEHAWFYVSIAIMAVWLGSIVNHVRRVDRLIERIENLGGDVQFDFNPSSVSWFERAQTRLAVLLSRHPRGELLEVKVHYANLDDRFFAELASIPTLERVELIGCRFDPAAFARLRSLTRLKTLLLQNSSFDDRSVPALMGMKDVEVLVLSGTKVTSYGLARIESLPQLNQLHTDQTEIDEEGLKWLARSPHLNYADFNKTRIGRRSLAIFAGKKDTLRRSPPKRVINSNLAEP